MNPHDPYEARSRRNGLQFQKPDLVKLARILLTLVPAGASEEELVKAAVMRWDDLHDNKIGEIVSLAESIRKGEDVAHASEGNHSAKRTEKVKVLRAWIREFLLENPKANVQFAHKEAKKAGVCDVTLQTFRTGHFYPVRLEVRAELKKLEAEAKKPKKPQLNTKPIGEVDVQFLAEENVVELEPKGQEIPDDHPALTRLDPKIVNAAIGADDPRGFGVASTGPGYLPEIGEGGGVSYAPVIEDEAGSFRFFEDDAPEDDPECDPACTVDIDSPMGTASYRLTVCGKVELEIHAPDVDSFLTLMNFMDGILKPITGTQGSNYSIPNIVQPVEEDDAS